MKKNRMPVTRIVTTLLCLTLPSLSIAGAWTAKKGTSYNKFALNYFSSDEVYDSNGDKQDGTATFTDLNLSYYMEYGVRDNLSFFLSIPYKQVESEENTGITNESYGVGDQEYGLRYNLYNGEKGVSSIQGLIKIPDFSSDDDVLPLGNDQVDIEIRYLYGRSLHPKPFYYGLELGYRYRDEGPSDELRYLAEVGYNASDSVYLRTKLDGSYSIDNADSVTDPTTGNPTLATSFDLGKLELTAGYKLGEKKFTEFTWTPAIYGQNTAAGDNFQIAFIIQLP